MANIILQDEVIDPDIVVVDGVIGSMKDEVFTPISIVGIEEGDVYFSKYVFARFESGAWVIKYNANEHCVIGSEGPPGPPGQRGLPGSSYTTNPYHVGSYANFTIQRGRPIYGVNTWKTETHILDISTGKYYYNNIELPSKSLTKGV